MSTPKVTMTSRGESGLTQNLLVKMRSSEVTKEKNWTPMENRHFYASFEQSLQPAQQTIGTPRLQ
jgi:hypothetical protein